MELIVKHADAAGWRKSAVISPPRIASGAPGPSHGQGAYETSFWIPRMQQQPEGAPCFDTSEIDARELHQLFYGIATREQI
jgi:hypothetical protein